MEKPKHKINSNEEDKVKRNPEGKEYSVKEISEKQVDEIIKRAKEGKLKSEDIEIIKWGFKTLGWVYRLVDRQKISLSKLKKILFGTRGEKHSDIIKDKSSDPGKAENNKDELQQKPSKGHGRNGASAYPGAKEKFTPHESLKPGDKCPECLKSKLYDFNRPGSVLRIKGSAPVKAITYKLQKLRCPSCQKLYTACLPKEAGTEKYDPESGSIIALLKYGNGFPFHRLSQFQNGQGVPLPASTQWDVIRSMYDKVNPAYEALKKHAAQGKTVYNDDTGTKILSLIKERKEAEKRGETPEKRTGTFTSGILSEVDGHQIALYFSGRKHAGENLDELLKYRSEELGLPIQMSDALSQNKTKQNETIHVNCLSHGRRKFLELLEVFPEECIYVIEIFRDVYKNDTKTKKKNMTPRDRLIFHQEYSGPLMRKLKQWFEDQFENRIIEENSSLGDAIKYMQNHWDKLTGFLTIEGAPLDNNAAERCLKRFIMHRKNAYFFKTEKGAHVGNVFMSIIETCHLEKVNPFLYLTALQKYCIHVKEEAEKWLPWNYENILAQLNTSLE